MKKDDNDWCITPPNYKRCEWLVEIKDTVYMTECDTAALCHAVLLLVDAINDKKVCQSAQKRWSRIYGFERVAEVIKGVKFVNGISSIKEELTNGDNQIIAA